MYPMGMCELCKNLNNNFQRRQKLNLEIKMSGITCVSPADFWVLTCLMISSIMVAYIKSSIDALGCYVSDN